VPLADVLDAITDAETQLTQLRETSPVPDQPDRGWVDDWLHRSHLDFWARHPQSLPERGGRLLRRQQNAARKPLRGIADGDPLCVNRGGDD